jgi:CBS domain-containing protein
MIASDLVEGITIPAPVTSSKSDTVLTLGALLSSWDVSSAIVMDNGKVIGAVQGYQLVAYLMNSPNQEILKRLLLPIGQVMEGLGLSQIPSLSHRNGLDSILKKVAQNRFGDIILTNDDALPIGVLSLGLIIPCLVLRKKKAAMRVRDVASRLKLVSEGKPLSDVLRYMMGNRIRRTVIKRNRDFYGVTERDIIRCFFSFKGLQSLSDNAKGYMDSSVGQLVGNQLKRLRNVNGNISVHQAWGYLVGDPSGCLIVDGDRIATPWDLVMKPFLEGKLLA